LQQIFPYVVVILWVGGALVLFSRARVKQRAYLRRFPPVDGFPLDAPLDRFMGMNPIGAAACTIRRAAWQRQTDPELERLRREAGQRTLAFALWVVLSPLLAFGVVALLVLTSNLH
jgi:hypothetical protein